MRKVMVGLTLVAVLGSGAFAEAQGTAPPAQNRQITGLVVDPGGLPLPGRRVELQRPRRFGPGRLVTLSDTEGRFRYGNVEAGTYRVVLVDAGQDVAEERIELDGDGSSPDVTLVQPAKEVRRASAGHFLRGQPVLSDFALLRDRLAAGGYGYELIVMDRTGRKMRGRVTRMTDEGLQLTTKSTLPLVRSMFPQGGAFPAESIARVQIVDSMWNGFLMGTVAMLAAPLVLLPICETQACVFYGALAVGSLPTLGMGIDQEINKPIYVNPAPAHVRLGPGPDPTPRAVFAQVRIGF